MNDKIAEVFSTMQLIVWPLSLQCIAKWLGTVHVQTDMLKIKRDSHILVALLAANIYVTSYVEKHHKELDLLVKGFPKRQITVNLKAFLFIFTTRSKIISYVLHLHVLTANTSLLTWSCSRCKLFVNRKPSIHVRFRGNVKMCSTFRSSAS